MDLATLLQEMIAGVERTKQQKVAAKVAEREKKKLAKAQAIAAIPSQEASEKTKENWRLLIKWQDQAIVLVTTVTVCRCCEARYTSVVPTLMVQRWHKTYGRHLTPIEPHVAAFSYLPRRKETVELTTKVCAACWDSFAPFESFQQSLPMFPENQGILVEESAACGGASPALTDIGNPGEGIEGDIETSPKVGALPIVRPTVELTKINHIYWPLVPVSQSIRPEEIWK